MTLINTDLPPRKSKARRLSLSLKAAIVSGMAIGILAPALVIGPLLAHESYQREIELRVQSLLTQYGKLLEHSLAGPVWHVDATAAQVLLDSVMLNPDVMRIHVEDASLGKFVSASKPLRQQGSVVSTTRPLMNQGQQIGRVTIDMTTEFVEQQFRQSMIKVAAALILQLGISFVLLFLLFEHRLMRPLRRLREDALRLSTNELEQPVVPMHDDEMGELALTLDKMRDKLNLHILQIREFNASLEQRVKERTQALHQANLDLQDTLNTLKNAQDEIQRTERLAALGALVAGIAHELNTPIGNCVTVASTLQELSAQFQRSMEGGLKRSDLQAHLANTRQAAEILLRNLRNAAELIGSFKQVAVDRTSAKRRAFQLDQMVAETVMTMGPGLKHSHYEIDCNIAAGIQMDSYPGPLGQVLNNLINNAILHGFTGRAHGRILVSADAPRDAQIMLCVSDNGNGIPPHNLSRIFDPFFTTRLGQGGSGLGLNIVHNLVKNVLGGNITVESELAVGTRFILSLPLNAPATEND